MYKLISLSCDLSHHPLSFPVMSLLFLGWPFIHGAQTRILLGWPLLTSSAATLTTPHTLSSFQTETPGVTYYHFDSLPFAWVDIILYTGSRQTERSQRPLALSSSSEFCRYKHPCCNTPVTPPLPLPPNIPTCFSHLFISSVAQLVHSLTVWLSLSLPRCYWQI